MSSSKIKVIYIMGAGRSGTTAIATFLGGHPKIQTLGEMHQFFEHLKEKRHCSCGKLLKECDFWSNIVNDLSVPFAREFGNIEEVTKQLEYHSSVPKHLADIVREDTLQTYIRAQETIFQAIASRYPHDYFLDSAKYIGRYLSLRKSKKLAVTAIYVVRDVRGVVNSFSKNVQSSRRPLSAIFYYFMINLMASIVIFVSPKGSVLKLKYEDFVTDPNKSLASMGDFLSLDMEPVLRKIRRNEMFDVAHLIGGNRLKKNLSIRLNVDEEWRKKQSRFQQIVYYLLAAPIMIFNRYKI